MDFDEELNERIEREEREFYIYEIDSNLKIYDKSYKDLLNLYGCVVFNDKSYKDDDFDKFISDFSKGEFPLYALDYHIFYEWTDKLDDFLNSENYLQYLTNKVVGESWDKYLVRMKINRIASLQ